MKTDAGPPSELEEEDEDPDCWPLELEDWYWPEPCDPLDEELEKLELGGGPCLEDDRYWPIELVN